MKSLFKFISILIFLFSCQSQEDSSLTIVSPSSTADSNSPDNGSGDDEDDSADVLTYILTPSETTYSFGPQPLGATVSNVFTLTNTGSGGLTSCSAASLSGANASDLSISSDLCSTNNLASGANCTIEVTSNSPTSGNRAADLNWSCSETSTTISLSLQTACPVNYILVPSNASTGTTTEFCVMKYEAKAWKDTNSDSIIDTNELDVDGCLEPGCSTQNWGTADHLPVSSENGMPWRRMGYVTSATACENLGVKYKLISNPEWMTIARNVEGVNSNWSGATVGSGCLFRGNVGINDACGVDETNPASGSGRDSKNKLTLNNGEEIWDFAGNVTESVDWTLGGSVDSAPTGCGAATVELPSLGCGGVQLADAEYNTSNGSYTSTQGIGTHYRELAFFDSGNPRRGGAYNFGINGGAFTLEFSYNPGVGIANSGFRCVYHP